MRVTITRKTMLHKSAVAKQVQALARKHRIPVTIGREKA